MMSLAPAPADLGYEARADAARAHMRMRSQQRSAGLQLHSAEQRVMHQYGNTLPRSNFGKGADTLVTKFLRRVDEVMIRDHCSRTEAMRKARQENEAEFGLFQWV
jgi:hypothetical protein